MRAHVLLLAAICAACGAVGTRQQPVEVADASVLVAAAAEGPVRVELAAVEGKERRRPVARLAAVRVRTTEDVAPVELRCARVGMDAGGLRIEAEEHRGHRVRMSLRPRGSSVDVEVWDDAALAAPLVQLELVYEMAVAADEWHAPAVDAVGVDWASPVPVGYLRAGSDGFAVVAAMELPNRTRRIATAMQAESPGEQGAARLVHGWRAVVSGAAGAQLDPAGRDVSGCELRLEHRLLLRAAEPGERAFARLLDELWAEGPHGPAPLHDRTIDQRIAAARASLLSGWREVSFGGRRYACPDRGELLATFRAGGATAAAAFAWSVAGQGIDAQARSLAELMLALPARGGLFPPRLVATAREGVAWEPSAAPLRAADSAWTADWMLALAAHAPELRDSLLAACERTAQFLRANQRPDGTIPASYESQYLRPTDDVLELDELAICVRFLFDHAIAAEDAASLASARAALLVLQQQAVRLSAAPMRTTALVALAANAAARSGSGAQPLARRALDTLAARQAMWSPGWIDAELRGCLVGDTDATVWSPPAQALAALAWFEAYAVSGRATELSRAAAALRAAIAALPDAGWSPVPPALPQPTTQIEETLALVEAVAVIARAWCGDAVLDFTSGRTQGIDAVWCENIVRDGDRIRLDLLTEVPDPPAARVQLRGLAPDRPWTLVVNGTALAPLSAEKLAAGITLQPRRVARVRFAPPREIAARSSWRPRAVVEAADPDAVALVTEIRRGDRLLAELPLVPRGDDGRWIVPATRSLPDELVRAGDQLAVRLRVEEQGRTTWLPDPDGRDVLVGDAHCIDPGHDDELELVAAGPSRVRRSRDVASSGRWVPRGATIRYTIPVPVHATQLALTFELRGGARIESEALVLHADRDPPGPALRTVTTTLADRRLWSAGSLPLSFTATGGDGLVLARIRHVPAGETASASGGGAPTAPLTQAPAVLHVRVIPLSLDDAPLHARPFELRNAMGDERPYVLTPEPHARRTAGSVTQLFGRLAGGATSFDAELTAEVDLPLLAADLPESAPERAAELARALRQRIHLAPGEVALVVHGERLRAQQGWITAPPFTFVAERDLDGAFVATGRLLRAILAARFPLPDRAAAAEGHFGTLALNATGDGHAPSGLLGVDLARIGWADVVQIDPAQTGSGTLLELAPLPMARAVHRLPVDHLHGRGELYLEAHAADADASEPASSGAGLLAYWRLPAPVHVQRADGTSARVHWLRLSAARPLLDTPFVPGSEADLLTRATLLDGSSTPSLATPHGDAPWELSELLLRGDGTMQARVRSLSVDLLPRTAGASQGEPGHTRPAGFGSESDPVRPVPDGLRLRATSEPVRAHLTAPPLGAARLFARIRPRHGEATLRILAGDQELLTWRSGATTAPLPLLLEWQPADTVTIELRPHGGTAEWLLEQATLVPRAPGSLPLGAFPCVAHAHLQDGAVHAPVLRLQTGTESEPGTILPLALPPGRAMLRLEAGRAHGETGEPLTLVVILRALDASWRTEVARLSFPAPGATASPLPLHLLGLQPPADARAAFLELRLLGPAGSSLSVPALALELAR